MSGPDRLFLSGNEAVALAARDGGITLGTGYPGTPSTEILESFSRLGGRAQWAPNEKVALEVGLGVAFTNARAHGKMRACVNSILPLPPVSDATPVPST